MTAPATFGEFLDAARRHLSPASIPARPANGEDLRDVGQGLRRLVLVLARYAQDAATGFDTWPDQPGRKPTAWDEALVRARGQLDLAADHLKLPVTLERVNLGTRPTSGLASSMDTAAFQLRTGRELLETHFGSGPDGLRRHHSEWAAPLASPAVRTALVAEIASIARQASDAINMIARQSGWRATPSLRHMLHGASRSLRMASTFVTAAQQTEPLQPAYRDLLYKIPASMLPPRRLPGTRDDIPYLRAGITASAQRTSRAWLGGGRAPGQASHDHLDAPDGRLQRAHQPPLRDPAPRFRRDGRHPPARRGRLARVRAGRPGRRQIPGILDESRARARPRHDRQARNDLPGRSGGW